MAEEVEMTPVTLDDAATVPPKVSPFGARPTETAAPAAAPAPAAPAAAAPTAAAPAAPAASQAGVSTIKLKPVEGHAEPKGCDGSDSHAGDSAQDGHCRRGYPHACAAAGCEVKDLPYLARICHRRCARHEGGSGSDEDDSSASSNGPQTQWSRAAHAVEAASVRTATRRPCRRVGGVGGRGNCRHAEEDAEAPSSGHRNQAPDYLLHACSACRVCCAGRRRRA